LTEEFFPPQVGGVEFMASYLSKGLAAHQLPVQVITRQTEPASAAEEWIGAVRVRRIAPSGQIKGTGWHAIPKILGYLARLFTILIKESPHYDVVVISGMKIIPLVAVPACRLLGKKSIIRVESSFEVREPISAESLGMMRALGGTLALRALERLQRSVVDHADRVIAVSDDIGQLLRRAGHSPARIANIPNAIDLSKFCPIDAQGKDHLRSRLGIPGARTIALFAGRLSRAKGIMMLIEAWPALIAAHPGLYLVIVGSGASSFDDCEADLARYIQKNGLSDHAVMVGQSDRVHEYLQAADFFVFPSDYEGFSLGLIEGLACGLPAAVTAVGAAPQLIRDTQNGFIFPPKDKEALSRAIEACLARRDEWPAIGQRARETVAVFDLPQVVEQYVALCRSLHRPKAS
jgi:glycosyltransferase involved in cell wall biosynthesis